MDAITTRHHRVSKSRFDVFLVSPAVFLTNYCSWIHWWSAGSWTSVKKAFPLLKLDGKLPNLAVFLMFSLKLLTSRATCRNNLASICLINLHQTNFQLVSECMSPLYNPIKSISSLLSLPYYYNLLFSRVSTSFSLWIISEKVHVNNNAVFAFSFFVWYLVTVTHADIN